ncbi:hypothetical protein CQ476_29 [TM7 phage DolZOral124_53_65]|nr:hypothetical protein CQ476_29 [TM7 phage DolZOral124_53_65]
MGMIIDGVYHADATPPAHSPVSTTVAGIHEQSRLEREHEKHAHDLIQPNHPDGTPNQAFIDYYPEDAKNHGLIEEEKQL